MKLLAITFYICFFFVLPIYLLNTLVMPQITSLSETYRGFDATAQSIANAK